ncbi:MAG: SWIM zinc finger family protein [Chloroflexi bacterium]|nr:SWIM zinc finger family protein [Chloroflexota bacterium]MCL5274519.1 SWIM zinc finger family protein [Chloroflexota bacterium]
MPIQLTEAMIRTGALKESLARGREYYREGAVYDTAISEDILTAKCRGAYAPHYKLRVEFDDAGVSNASCTCAYEYGGYCKHIVALLLAYLNAPASFETQTAPQDLLRELDRDQMVELLTALMRKHEDVRNAVERWVAGTVRKSAAAKSADRAKDTPQRRTVDDTPYRKRIRALIREAGEYYNPYDEGENEELVQGLDEIRQVIVDFLDADQPRDALAIATAVLDEIRKSQDYVEYELNELEDFTDQLDMPIAEAVLSTELSSAEKKNLQKAIGDDDYGYPAARDALEYGWTATSRADEEDDNDDEDDEVAEAGDDEVIEEYIAGTANDWRLRGYLRADVVDAQLNVLNRRGDHERYLATALAAGRHLRYTQKLVELGRGPEAAQYAAQHFKRAGEALTLAQQLHAVGQVDEVLAIAGYGLRLAQPRAELGRWLAPIAKSRKDNDLALRAWMAVFDEDPSLSLYQKIKALAGKKWDKTRTNLHEQLAHSWQHQVHAEILLYEQDWDAAIALANKTRGGFSSQVVEIVADGVMQHRPDWVVEIAKQSAQALIDTVSSSHYPEAAEWLARVKKAYRILGQGSTWDAYLARLREDYRRRPSLQRALKAL